MSGTIELKEREKTNFNSSITSLAAEILMLMNGSRYLYRSKLMGVIYLCEYHLELKHINGQYCRSSSGPMDFQLLEIIESDIRKAGWIADYQRDDEHPDSRFRKVGFTIESNNIFHDNWEEHKKNVRQLAILMKPMDWEQMKLITTIYATWNDLLLSKRSFTDRKIIADALNNWPSGNRKIPKKYWYSVLAWLRSKNLVPHGYGHHTIDRSLINSHRQTG